LQHKVQLEILEADSVTSGFAIAFRPFMVLFSKDIIEFHVCGWLRYHGLGIFPFGPARRKRRNIGISNIGTEDTQKKSREKKLHDKQLIHQYDLARDVLCHRFLRRK